ncbi:MAG: hypothetical protein Kapaf2KO_06630 [Candidatus Kapaibacteriales bacterium]
MQFDTEQYIFLIDSLPFGLELLFIACGLFSFFIFYLSSRNTKHALATVLGTIAWLTIQSFLSSNGFYTDSLSSLPPKIFAFGLLPFNLFILLSFALPKIRTGYTAKLGIGYLILLSTVRLPVEIGLAWLAGEGAVPEIMSFHGWNYDIIMGITAPFFWYFHRKGWLKRSIFIAWNLVGTILLLTIIITAILSAPFPFQQLAFDNPNIAVLYFPYSWLAVFIAPLVLYTHIVMLYQALALKKI